MNKSLHAMTKNQLNKFCYEKFKQNFENGIISLFLKRDYCTMIIDDYGVKFHLDTWWTVKRSYGQNKRLNRSDWSRELEDLYTTVKLMRKL